jgi:hypothetical protein
MLCISEEAGALFRKWIHDFFEAEITDREVLRRTVADLKAFLAEEIRQRRVARNRRI